MQYRLILETTGEMRVTIEVPGATGAEKAEGCKATIWTSTWPKPEADLCALDAPCARCTAIRAVQDHILPEATGFKIKIDKIKPIVSAAWALGMAPEGSDANSK